LLAPAIDRVPVPPLDPRVMAPLLVKAPERPPAVERVKVFAVPMVNLYHDARDNEPTVGETVSTVTDL